MTQGALHGIQEAINGVNVYRDSLVTLEQGSAEESAACRVRRSVSGEGSH